MLIVLGWVKIWIGSNLPSGVVCVDSDILEMQEDD